MEEIIYDEKDEEVVYHKTLRVVKFMCTTCNKDAGECYVSDIVFSNTLSWKFICKECQEND